MKFLLPAGCSGALVGQLCWRALGDTLSLVASFEFPSINKEKLYLYLSYYSPPLKNK
jgi:hypothetical protein